MNGLSPFIIMILLYKSVVAHEHLCINSSISFSVLQISIYIPVLMLPNIVFQIAQPSLIVIYQSLNIFP